MKIGLTLPLETDSCKDIGPKNKKPYELYITGVVLGFKMQIYISIIRFATARELNLHIHTNPYKSGSIDYHMLLSSCQSCTRRRVYLSVSKCVQLKGLNFSLSFFLYYSKFSEVTSDLLKDANRLQGKCIRSIRRRPVDINY
jgi:hypothetical protein